MAADRFRREQQLREVKRARAACYKAPLNAGYPPRRALACERGAARAPPWITAVFCWIPLETISFSRMLRRELQAENEFSQIRFSLERVLQPGYLRHSSLG